MVSVKWLGRSEISNTGWKTLVTNTSNSTRKIGDEVFVGIANSYDSTISSVNCESLIYELEVRV